MAVRKHWADDETPEVPDNVIEAPITPRRTTVSEILRARRIECGLEVSHVAQVLRIRQPVLVAIENGQFDLLPGAAYAVGFVRSYGTYLGLDSEALVLRFKAETEEASRRPTLEFPLPIRDSRVPTGPLLIICVLLAVITYGGWYYVTSKPGQLADMVPGVPERLHRLLDKPAPQPLPAPAQIVATQPAASMPVAPQPAPAAGIAAIAEPQQAPVRRPQYPRAVRTHRLPPHLLRRRVVSHNRQRRCRKQPSTAFRRSIACPLPRLRHRRPHLI